jgi:hypothetical protein
VVEQSNRVRIYSHFTKTRFLNVEAALEIGKLRFFTGEYSQGKGASAMAFHFLDVVDARVVLGDLAWGKAVRFTDHKGSEREGKVQSRVLTIKTKGDTVWFEVKNGPGEVMGQGAVKPKGDPDVDVSIGLSIWDSRRLAAAVLAYVAAWECRHLLEVTAAASRADVGGGEA